MNRRIKSEPSGADSGGKRGGSTPENANSRAERLAADIEIDETRLADQRTELATLMATIS